MINRERSDAGMRAFQKFAELCPHRIDVSVPRRRANALCIEVGEPASRCKLREPTDWVTPGLGARWLMSGGDQLVLGERSRSDWPTGNEWCPECGHLRSSHLRSSHGRGGSCRVTRAGNKFPCGCEYYWKSENKEGKS